ncbi:ACP S-malonyltransferase [candidate division GN15 bacterium]|nr:ACP S-malonyltransferase [candidate division GN15 bacterium]
MSKTALFFPGQASQYVGMGKDLYDASAEVRRLYAMASELIGEDLAKLSFEGPAETLKQTRFTQPAILVHSLAVLTMLGDKVPAFDYAAGHSLGEYGALAAAGAMSYEDAVKAVVRRAALMEDACQKNPGTMAAVMGLDPGKTEEVCSRASGEGVVVPANFNSAVQIAVSGSIVSVEEAVRLAKEQGAKRAVMLEVGGAFHSPLMASAKDGMASYLEEIAIKHPTKPVIANVTARPVQGVDDIRRLLIEQITSPVRWAQTMQFLADEGVTRVIEVGPGKVLASLAKRDMCPETLLTLDTLADLEKIQ